ncbi:MAG: DUF6279 family lipoprotein [Rhodoferax sp.]|nr:DUF6279 family lipoprotein [Rhodoferax sp.]
MRRIIRALLWPLLVVSLLMGCSMVRVGYEQLPNLGYWWVDSYLDVNDTQSVTLRTDLLALHTWHRTHELPQLAHLLTEVQTQAAQDTTPAQVCQIADRVRSRLEAVLAQSEPGLARLVVTLENKQLQHLKHQLDKRAQKWRDDWPADEPAAVQTRRLERLVERTESFYGALSDAQMSLMRSGVQDTPYDTQTAELDMLRRHQDLLQTLQGLAGSALPLALAQQRIHGLLARTLQPPNAGYRAQIEQYIQGNCNTLARLHNSATPAQRQKLIAKLKGYEDDARRLTLR